MAQDKSPRRTRKKRSREEHPDAERVLQGKLYRVDEVAQILQIGETEVRKLITTGELTAARIAGAYRMTETAIRAYVDARNEEAADAAAMKRRERERQRQLELRRQLDPAMRWAFAQCIWCGIESMLCTRNDRLSGEISCEDCLQAQEIGRHRGERFTRTKDVVERSVAIQVRERDDLADEGLSYAEEMQLEALIESRVRQAETMPLLIFAGDETEETVRASMIAEARRRPPHYFTFRCPLCDR